MRPRFLLDEHVNRAVQRQLRRRSVEVVVLAIGDPEAPPAGTSDPDLLVWLERHRALLVTENRSTMTEHLAAHFAAGHHIPGILWIRPVCVWAASLKRYSCSSPVRLPTNIRMPSCLSRYRPAMSLSEVVRVTPVGCCTPEREDMLSRSIACLLDSLQ